MWWTEKNYCSTLGATDAPMQTGTARNLLPRSGAAPRPVLRMPKPVGEPPVELPEGEPLESPESEPVPEPPGPEPENVAPASSSR